MQKTLIFIVCFVVVNAALAVLHITIFQGTHPYWAFRTLIIHLIVLILFPYKKVFKSKS